MTPGQEHIHQSRKISINHQRPISSSMALLWNSAPSIIITIASTQLQHDYEHFADLSEASFQTPNITSSIKLRNVPKKYIKNNAHSQPDAVPTANKGYCKSGPVGIIGGHRRHLHQRAVTRCLEDDHHHWDPLDNLSSGRERTDECERLIGNPSTPQQ
jgi:hypothetical protein